MQAEDRPPGAGEVDEFLQVSSSERVDMKMGNRNVPYICHKVPPRCPLPPPPWTRLHTQTTGDRRPYGIAVYTTTHVLCSWRVRC